MKKLENYSNCLKVLKNADFRKRRIMRFTGLESSVSMI